MTVLDWLLENTQSGQVHFALEAGDGRPSRWNALHHRRTTTRWTSDRPAVVARTM